MQHTADRQPPPGASVHYHGRYRSSHSRISAAISRTFSRPQRLTLGPIHFSRTLSDDANSSPAPISARPSPGVMLGSRRKNSRQFADPQSLTSTAVPTEHMINALAPIAPNAELAIANSLCLRARLQFSLSSNLPHPTPPGIGRAATPHARTAGHVAPSDSRADSL